MGDQNSSSTRAVAKQQCQLRPRRHAVVDEEVDRGDSMACTGKSCQSCNCVAVCCCPCAVVNLLALAFLKLPWAVARRWLGRGGKMKQKQKQKMVGEERKWFEGDMDGISRKRRACEGISGLAVEEETRAKICAGTFEIEEIWYEVGHLGFGRVSFTGVDSLNHHQG